MTTRKVSAKKTPGVMPALTAIDHLALCKAVNEKSEEFKAHRASVEPGSYPIDTCVRIYGTIKVGADTTNPPDYTPKTLDALVLLMETLGIDKEVVKKQLPKMLSKADRFDAQQMELLRAEYGIDTIIKEHKTDIQSTMERVPRKGSVTATLFVEKLED